MSETVIKDDNSVMIYCRTEFAFCKEGAKLYLLEGFSSSSHHLLLV